MNHANALFFAAAPVSNPRIVGGSEKGELR